jgi:hypothetical protein
VAAAAPWQRNAYAAILLLALFRGRALYYLQVRRRALYLQVRTSASGNMGFHKEKYINKALNSVTRASRDALPLHACAAKTQMMS